MTIAAAVTLVVTTIRNVDEKGPPSEVGRLEQLQGGMAFARFQTTLGAKPDIQRPAGEAPDAKFLVGKGATRYIFVRPDVYVQAVVADGTVVGFSIVARTPRLRPKFNWRTSPIAVTLGRSKFSPYDPDHLGGFCGANRAQYFEVFGGSNADNAQAFAVGASSLGLGGDRAFDTICAASNRLFDCDADMAYANVMFQSDAAECFLQARESGRLRKLVINTYVETAPNMPMFSELLVPLEPEVEGVTPAS